MLLKSVCKTKISFEPESNFIVFNRMICIPGSFVVKRVGVKDSCKKAAKCAFLLQFAGIFILCCFLVPGCENSKIVGVHHPYYNR